MRSKGASAKAINGLWREMPLYCRFRLWWNCSARSKEKTAANSVEQDRAEFVSFQLVGLPVKSTNTSGLRRIWSWL
jgi:hypothetical protein